MEKATILDRLAGAMKTLGKREGKALTPRQRVAAAQRWNRLAGIGRGRIISADERAASFDPTTAARGAFERDNIQRYLMDMRLIGNDGWNRADNPFLSGNIDKYAEQSDFLDWCHYKHIEPNARSLKQFRWETYKKLPYRQRQWIANKDAVRDYLDGMYGYDRKELDRINTLDELDDYLQTRHPEDEWPSPYDMQDSEVFESIDEFPDDFDYMWRY